MHHVKEITPHDLGVVDIPPLPHQELDPHSRKKVITASPGDEWSKVRKLAIHQLERFISLEPKVLRGDDPDAIHDMRVASRRLQQVLDLLYPPSLPGEIRKLRRVIRRSRRSLSDVRNCDVLLLSVRARLARKRTSRRETWAALEDYLSQRRSKTFEKALRKISKMNVAGFYINLKGHLTLNGNKSRSASHKLIDARPQELAHEQFYDRIGKDLDRMTHAFEDQIAQSLGDPRASIIHGARVATKRLRYLIEVIREFGVPGSDDLLAWLRNLQRHLGEWHDKEVLEEIMIEMVARREFLRDRLDVAMGIEKLILRNRVDKKALEEKYFEMTRDSMELRQMRDWVAYLLSSASAAFAKA